MLRQLLLPVGITALASVGAAAGIYAAVTSGSGSTTIVERTTQFATAPTPDAFAARQIYARAYRGVVQITGTETTALSRLFGGRQAAEEVEGSGFVYATGGHIVTNYHVVKGATSIQVALFDGSKYSATIVGDNPSEDLAVLRVDAPPAKLHPLTLGDSSQMEVGDPVVAIGNPLGYTDTATAGIVSALGRTIGSDDSHPISGAIQTDAPINHGNSGGPLLDARGQVIGVTTEIASSSGGSEGIGFAISSNTVRSVVSQLLRS